MNGQVVVVTGGAGKLGQGICRALKKEGAAVVALDLDPSRAESVDISLACDVTDPAACKAAVDQTVEQLGRVDTLVNTAQVFVCDTPLLELTDADMEISLTSGPIATLRMMQLCYPHMKARGGGAIVNFVSGAGTQGGLRMGAYAAAKEAIRGLTKTAALEWGPDNIRVNALAPFGGTPESRTPLHDQVVQAAPLRRYGDPETDIGHAVVFLATNEYITGRTLHIDGGIGMFR